MPFVLGSVQSASASMSNSTASTDQQNGQKTDQALVVSKCRTQQDHYPAFVNGCSSGGSDAMAELHNDLRLPKDTEKDTGKVAVSTRREIVALIDFEPTFDYLIQNGVLTRNEVSEICCDPESVSQNRRLLELVESRPELSGIQLLTNVLRLTGQHYLANLLDDGARIKALSGSGYLSKSRRTGQVGITIRIVSIHAPLDPQIKAISALLGTEWISLEDIQTKMSSLKRSQRLSVVHLDAISVKVAADETRLAVDPSDYKDESSGCCWCCCRRSSKKRVASKKIEAAHNDSPADAAAAVELLSSNETTRTANQPPAAVHEQKAVVVTYQPGHRTKSASIECIAVGNWANGGQFVDENMSSLRRAADRVHGRCTAIYDDIYETGSESRVAVERYFEQDRGVLVLNVESLGAGSGVEILCICTLAEHVQKLKNDVENGRLKSDLEKVVSAASKIPVRLDVCVDRNDLELVESELIK